MKKVLNKASIYITVDKTIVEFNEVVTVSLQATGEDVYEGLKIPYRILSGPSPFGSDVVLIDFVYDKDTDYYYLNVILSSELGSNILTVEQLSGDPVVIEKVDDLIYKYKNPLDKQEVSRTFRATLKTIETDANTIKGVRSFDFIYSNEYGFLELDSNLSATRVFKNNVNTLNNIDRIFNFSLYYMPQYNVSALFKSNYIPHTPYPDKPILNKPKIRVETLTKNIVEGEDAVFRVFYENIRNNFKIEYEYLDTKDTYNSESFFVTEDTGYIDISIPTIVLQTNISNTRYIRLWIKKYPSIFNIIYVTTLPVTKYEERFKPGTYFIPLQPYNSYEVTLIGAGGAGGGSVWNRTGNWNVNAKGEDGGDTYILLDGNEAIASGGLGGGDAHWHNGSAFYPGMPGKGGINDGGTFIIKANIKGLDGTYVERGQQPGGVAITTLGDLDYNGAGGKGGYGCGDESLATGGAGGSGGLITCTIRNDTSRIKELKLIVGEKGKVFDLGSHGTWGNNGQEGEHGFAIIKSL